MTLSTADPINMKVFPSRENSNQVPASASYLAIILLLSSSLIWPFFQNNFFFIICRGCFSKPFPLNLSLCGAPPSKFMPPSHSSLLWLLSLTLFPSNFILPLPLIWPSISLVHSSLSFLQPDSSQLHPFLPTTLHCFFFFTVYLLPVPLVPSFFSHSFLFLSSIFMLH